MRRLVVLSMLLGFVLGCAGLFGDSPCCTVDDVVAMHESGVETPIIIDAVCNSQVDIALTAEDITTLSTAGVEREVIDVMSNDCQDGEAAKQSAGPAPPLNIKVVQNNAKSIEVFNMSGRRYTNVKLVINGEYQYRVKRLPAGKGDVMQYGSFRSVRTGAELKRRAKLRSISITADQGSYARTF